MAFLTEAANRGSISTGFDIANSLKLESDNNEHLYRAMANGNRITWTYSCWFKRTELGFTNVLIHFGVNHQATRMMLNDDDTLYLDVCNTDNELYRSITSRKFRDTSAWYHVVWRMDTTQSVAANRMKLYINGVEETSWSQQQLPPENYDTLANTTAGGYDDMGIGTYVWAGSNYDGQFSGYIAQVAHVDGQSYAPTEFGEFDDDSGIWKPKDVSGLTYGTGNNSFFLDFEIASDLGANAKGNDANWSLTNVAAADQATDTPTNNFATLNLQVPNYANTGGATEGGTKIPWAGTNSYGAFYATQGVTAGKWYWEFYIPSRSSSYGLMNYIGLHTMEELILTSPYRSEAMKNNVFWLMHYGDWYAHVNGSQSSQNTVAGLSSRGTDAIGKTYAIAFNADDGEMTYYENGTRISNLEFDIFDLDDRMAAGVFVVPWFQVYHNDMNVNFGGYSSIAISSGNTDANGYGNFEYAPPSGYYALCSKNLAEFG